MLRAGRRLEAVMRGLAGPSRLYATVPTTITGQSRGPPLGTQMTVMGTPSPIPVLKGTGERPAYEEREVGENGEDVELEEPVFQPPPMLDTPTRGYLEPQPLPRTHGVYVAILPSTLLPHQAARPLHPLRPALRDLPRYPYEQSGAAADPAPPLDGDQRNLCAQQSPHTSAPSSSSTATRRWSRRTLATRRRTLLREWACAPSVGTAQPLALAQRACVLRSQQG